MYSSDIKYASSGYTAAQIPEASATVFEIIKIIMNRTRSMVATNGIIAMAVPTAVATPFPPLNPKNIGNM